jgi:hypothetical protein
MIRFPLAILSVALGASLAGAAPSPENQVFQFSASGVNDTWPDGSTSKGTLYLWIPEKCQRLRGLVVMATNVPEHRLAGHESIRRACVENDLGLIWSVPTFWNFAKQMKGRDDLQVAFFQRLLDQLAESSGYLEVATVPWLPVGESAHLLMVCGMVNQKPERCIAAICVKNPQLPENKTVPMLWTLGTAQEWGQTAKDPRESWKPATFNYQGWVNDRVKSDWPLSIVVEPGSGHFYCTEAMTDYFASYISAACRARLSDDGSPALKPVSLERGVLADLPLPGRDNPTVTPYAEAIPAARARPWFFDASTARGAQAFAATDWNAATAMPSITAVSNCIVDPFSFNSVTALTVTTDSEFAIKPILLDRVSSAFVGAGEPLATPPVEPVAEWICGPWVPLGGGRFRIALDRTWKTGAASYMALRQDASPGVRFGVQPVAVRLLENNEGTAQTIRFDPIQDLQAGSKSLDLKAESDAGLPVGFFVVAGPAIVTGKRLELTAIPPRARFPIEVTIAAWQWGRNAEPKIKTAPMIRRTFRVVAPVH